jgi:poly-gamma-glutamate synthesis protein (capsule biosynthesis protein)
MPGSKNILYIILSVLSAMLLSAPSPRIETVAAFAPEQAIVEIITDEMPELQPVETVVEEVSDENSEEEIGALPEIITLSAAGDFTLGGDVQSQGESRFATAYDEHGAEWFLANVREIFESDDLTIVNLEGTLTEANTRRANRQFLFRGKPEYTDILTAGGVDIANTANNHANDFLADGRADTLAALDDAGVPYFGYDNEYYTDIKGVTFGFVGLTEWDYTERDVTERVAAADIKCDILVVSFHWGIERQYTPSPTQVTLGHAAVDAGADLIIGSHPHVLGEIEEYNGVNIVYSLGNFCYGGHGNPSDKDTMIFRQEFIRYSDGRIETGNSYTIPCSISSVETSNNFQPTPII